MKPESEIRLLFCLFSDQNPGVLVLQKVGMFSLSTQISRVDFPIIINWMSPLSLLGASGVIFHFYFIFDEKICTQTEKP